MAFWSRRSPDDDDDADRAREEMVDGLVNMNNRIVDDSAAHLKSLSEDERARVRLREKEAEGRAHIFRSELIALGDIAGGGEAVCTIAQATSERIVFILGPKGLPALHMGIVVTLDDLEAIQAMIAEFRRTTQTKRGHDGR